MCFNLNFATLAELIPKLNKSNSEWVLGEVQQDAFDYLRVALTSDCVVGHYDQSEVRELKVGASLLALGVILLLHSNDTVCPVAYAIHTLTDAERQFS